MAGAKESQLIFTKNLQKDLSTWTRKAAPSLVVLICDERFTTVAQQLSKSLPASTVVTVRGAERSKRLKEMERIVGKMIREGADRKSLVVALGGGVVGDLAGFVASVYMRGIRWVSIPTTLLAMVDSGYGGKTAINHKLLKNSIGTFHQPEAVFVFPGFLKSLKTRDLVSGAGEILKYGLLWSPQLFRTITPKEVSRWRRQPQRAMPALRKCLQLKRAVVRSDLEDRAGVRQALNLGHTLGHALEAATQYRHYRHGEAVILGLEFALRVSAIQEKVSRSRAERSIEHLRQFSLPRLKRNLVFDDIWNLMKKDKKSEYGDVKMVLLGARSPLMNQSVSAAESLLALIELASGWRMKLK